MKDEYSYEEDLQEEVTYKKEDLEDALKNYFGAMNIKEYLEWKNDLLSDEEW
jgi:hypothetical protein